MAPIQSIGQGDQPSGNWLTVVLTVILVALVIGLSFLTLYQIYLDRFA